MNRFAKWFFKGTAKMFPKQISVVTPSMLVCILFCCAAIGQQSESTMVTVLTKQDPFGYVPNIDQLELKIQNQLENRRNTKRVDPETLARLEKLAGLTPADIEPLQIEFATPLDELLARFLPVVLESREAVENLEIVGDQLGVLKDIVGRYKTDRALVLAKVAVMPANEVFDARENIRVLELMKLAESYRAEIKDNLQPFQANAIQSARATNGSLLKMVVESPMAAVWNISEDQKAEIRKRSEKLADEIRAFIEEKRKESSAVFTDVLTEEQLREIADHVGHKRIIGAFEQAQPSQWILEVDNLNDNKTSSLENTAISGWPISNQPDKKADK